jgi:hypothetical protein
MRLGEQIRFAVGPVSAGKMGRVSPEGCPGGAPAACGEMTMSRASASDLRIRSRGRPLALVTAVAFAGTTLPPRRYRATIAVTSQDLPGVEAAVPVDVVLAAPPSCLGDCDGNGAVTINELITGVNLALAAQQLAQCPAFNRNYDGLVTIDELVAAVSNALGRCPSPERTP